MSFLSRLPSSLFPRYILKEVTVIKCTTHFQFWNKINKIGPWKVIIFTFIHRFVLWNLYTTYVYKFQDYTVLVVPCSDTHCQHFWSVKQLWKSFSGMLLLWSCHPFCLVPTLATVKFISEVELPMKWIPLPPLVGWWWVWCLGEGSCSLMWVLNCDGGMVSHSQTFTCVRTFSWMFCNWYVTSCQGSQVTGSWNMCKLFWNHIIFTPLF